MKRVIKIALLTFISITVLSGCLVEKKDLEKIARTTDKLHIYKANDLITYSVDELRFSDFSTRTGTLSIQWLAHTPIRRPGTTTDITVLEEVIKLSFDGGATETGTVRYISQDDVTGEVTIHAIQAPGLNEYYWLSTSDIFAAPGPTTSFPIFTSPMGVGIDPPPVTFHIMEGCEVSGLCAAHFGRYSDDMNIVGDTTSITSSLGVFSNPFQISFNGTTIPEDGGFPIVDVRNICGATTTTHAGTMYVMPEIGVIQMTNTCYDPSGSNVQHTIKIRSASFY